MDEFYLIVGLGNPGDGYKNTRHNTGFRAIDCFSQSHDLEINNNKFGGLVCKTKLFNKNVVLLKPQTFMNKSGESVIQVVNFYKIPLENIVVISDDMDLEVGRVRLKPKGSCGGHNGLKNIFELLGSEDIKRIKIGIGKPEYNYIDYVLSTFSVDEEKHMQQAFNAVKDALNYYLEYDFEKSMSKYNQ